MSDKLDINKQYYNWNIKQGDYKPEIDDSYKKYKKKQKVLKRAFVFSAIVILVSSIIVYFATR